MLRLAVATLLAAGGALLVVLGLSTLLGAAGVGYRTGSESCRRSRSARLPRPRPHVAVRLAWRTGSRRASRRPVARLRSSTEVVLIGAGDLALCDGMNVEATAALLAERPVVSRWATTRLTTAAARTSATVSGRGGVA